MANSPARKDAPRAQAAELQPETIIVEHSVTAITDAYISVDGDLLVIRKLRPGSDQALGVNEITLTPDAAGRLRELMNKFLAPGIGEASAVLRPIVSQRDQSGPVPDVIARFLREEEEEMARAKAKDKLQNEANAEQRGSTALEEPDGSEFFPERPAYVIRKGLMPTRAPKEK